MKMLFHLWTKQSKLCINVKEQKTIMIQVEILMVNKRRFQQNEMESSKKSRNQYALLVILFCLLLLWKAIFATSHILGVTWANFFAYCWVFVVTVIYLKVSKQSFAKFLKLISAKFVFYG